MPFECDKCGATTEIPETFFKERRSFRKTTRTLCPRCWKKDKASIHFKLLAFQLMPGPIGLLVLLLMPHESAGWFLLNLFLLQLLLIVLILPHEWGHAWAAKLAGWFVYRIYIGFGKTLAKRKFLGFVTEFHAVPVVGLVLAAPSTKKHFQATHFVFVLAGPAVTVALMVLGAWLCGFKRLFDFHALETGLAPGQLFAYANGLLLLGSLWPAPIATPLGKLSSDVKLLLQNLRSGDAKAGEYHAASFVLEALAFRDTGQYEKARSCLENGLAEYPDNLPLLSYQGINLLDLREFAKARDFFIRMLDLPLKEPGARSMIQNNIAYVDVLLEKAELLDEAERYSAAAIADLSWMPPIIGTRGAVLVELGRVEEGIQLLLKSMEGHEEANGKALNACSLAMAEAKRGNLEQGRKYLEEARRLDPKCFLLEKALEVDYLRRK